VIENLVPEPTCRTLVDVGCGAGIFIEAGNSRGWATYGIEPSRVAAAHCKKKGLNIIEDIFTQELADLPAHIDVVHMRNVLEHVHDPAALIKSSHHVLADNGLLVVAVPNDYNKIQMGLRDVKDYSPWWVAIPHHLNYFSFESLESLVGNNGFKVIERFASFPIDLFLTIMK